MSSFQINDGTFSLALYDRATAEEALMDYFADRARGDVRCKVQTDEDGNASVTFDGVTYTALKYDPKPRARDPAG